MLKNLQDLYRIDNFNDTFALGHYARVMDALDRRTGLNVAFKVMRPEHLAQNGNGVRWEYRAFGHEARLLSILAGSPQVVDLLDCGFVSAKGEYPEEGAIESFQLDTMGFTEALESYASEGWRPYLTLQNLPRTENLLYLMKPNQPNSRWRLPSEEGLSLALQFGQMLEQAHQQGIVYLDHKLEHVYWDGIRLRIIDFNSSRLLENGGDRAEFLRQDIHNLCVGILYPVFTGLSPRKAQLRPQPGRVTDVEERYKDINTLDFGVEPTLSDGIKNLLQAGAALELADTSAFLEGLQEAGAALGWDFPEHYTSPDSRDARTQMRAGLTRLRKGQEELREARDLFREAAIQEGITADLERELRRLVKAVNEMLNQRVIP